ncbi:MAG: Vitamin transporter BtuB precursor [Verrucomicrobiota bacterium]|jgi:vitamin B12 transporter
MKSFLPASGFARRCLLILAAGALPALLSAQTPTVRLTPVVVTATRTANDPVAIGTAVDVISSADLARRQQDTLASALGGLPGAPLFASGATGATTSLFLRGANSNQTLFLVDGIRLNDANADYNVFLGGAALGAGTSLEVARGPQSTLYGSDAIGGAVAILSERGEGPSRTSVSTEGGSFGTVRGAVATAGASGPWGYNFSVNGGHTNNDRVNNAFGTAGANARIDRTVSESLSVGATARWFHGEYNDPGDRFTNDTDDSSREDNLLVTLFADTRPAPGWSVHATAGGQDRRFVSNASFGPFGPNSNTVTTNRRGVLDAQATYSGIAHHRFTAGTTAETTQTRNTGFGAINRHQTSLAFFAQDEFSPSETVNLTAGLRSDDFDTFGRATTGRLAAAWQVVPRQVKLRASYGTGFHAPSFLDLYGQSPFYVGYPNLKSEHARGWDAGVDLYNATRSASTSLTWFENRFTDLITGIFPPFPAISTVANIARARTRGLEWSANVHLTESWETRVSYTYLEAENQGTGADLLRRPRQSGTADLWHDFGRGFTAGAGVSFAADRRDIDARTFATIDAEDYTVARLYAAWQINRGGGRRLRQATPSHAASALPGIRPAKPDLTIKVRLENLLDEQYEPVNGYPATGFGAFGGVEWRL